MNLQIHGTIPASPQSPPYWTPSPIGCQPIGSSSPVVGEEEEVGKGEGHLQPAPVGDVVGHQRENEDADAEKHLIEDSHRASELHPDDLRH